MSDVANTPFDPEAVAARHAENAAALAALPPADPEFAPAIAALHQVLANRPDSAPWVGCAYTDPTTQAATAAPTEELHATLPDSKAGP